MSRCFSGSTANLGHTVSGWCAAQSRPAILTAAAVPKVPIHAYQQHHQQALAVAAPATTPARQQRRHLSCSAQRLQNISNGGNCRASSSSIRRPQSQCQAAKGAAGSSSSSSSGKLKQQGPPDITNNMDDMEDVIMIEDDEDEVEDDEGLVNFIDDDEFEDEDFDDEFAADEGEDALLQIGSDDDPGPEVLTGNVAWGDAALKVAEAVLQRPENSNLSLYLFRVLVPTKTIEIRLDKLDDVYGSPGLEDIERFSRALAQGLEAELGAETAGDISVEVSSPGAERTLIIPQDLLRFKDLPMRVEYMNDVGLLTNVVLKFAALDEAEGITTWELADVKANQNVKGRGLSKRQRMQRYDIRLESLERVRIYVDF